MHPDTTRLALPLPPESRWLQEMVAEQSARAWLWVRYGIRYEARRLVRRAKDAYARSSVG